MKSIENSNERRHRLARERKTINTFPEKESWNMKVTVTPFIVGVLGTNPKNLEKILVEMNIRGMSVTVLTATLGSDGDLLSIALQWKPLVITVVKNSRRNNNNDNNNNKCRKYILPSTVEMWEKSLLEYLLKREEKTKDRSCGYLRYSFETVKYFLIVKAVRSFFKKELKRNVDNCRWCSCW